MGEIATKASAVFRDFTMDGVAASGRREPPKAEIRDLFKLIDVAAFAAQAGLTMVADIAGRNAFFADEANRAKLVYVNNNNGAPDDPANGVYEYVSGAARLAEGFYQGVAAVVQPLVDDAEGAASAAEGFAAASATSSKAGRAWISGRITTLTWSGTAFASTPTVAISAGEQWEEANSGAAKRKIAAVAATALADGEGLVVNFDSGATDETGAYIPTKVAVASGAAAGWQTAGRYVLVARTASGLLFGHYVNNSPDLAGAASMASRARAWISGSVKSVVRTSTAATITLATPGYMWIENNSGNPYRTIAPLGPIVLNAGEAIVVDFDGGAVDGTGRYIPTKVVAASSGAAGWQSRQKFVLIGLDAAGNLFGEYALPPDNPNVGVYDAEVGFSTAPGTPLPTWNAATRTLAWPEMVLICKKASYTGRIKLEAGSVVFPAGNYLVASLDLAQVDQVLTPNAAVAVNSYVGGGWGGDDTGRIPLFCVNGDTAYPVRFPPVQGSLIGPGAPGAVSAYDPSEIVVLQAASQIDIFKKGSNPASNRYLRYRMQRVPTPAISSDVWRWNEVWECERIGEFTFNALTRLAQGGEIEMAIRQDGKSDFMGGTAHGDEELFSATFMVDGVVKPLGGAATYRARRAEFLQGSDMYEVDTVPPKSNRVAKSYKRWIFDAEKVDVINDIAWEDDLTLAQCFMAMLTWLRMSGAVQISDKGYRAPLWTEEDISLAGFAEIGTSANIAKASGPTGYSAEVEILEGWTRPNRRFNFSPAAEYNKFYFEFCGAGYAVTTGEVMRSHARYRIDTIN